MQINVFGSLERANTLFNVAPKLVVVYRTHINAVDREARDPSLPACLPILKFRSAHSYTLHQMNALHGAHIS